MLDVGDGHLDRAGAEVQPEQGLGARHAAPLEELVVPNWFVSSEFQAQ